MNYFKSKTVWFGLLIVILSWVQQAVAQFDGLTPDQITLIGSITGALVVWLRAVTTTAIEDK
jgi:carboxylesterase type B